MNADKHMKWAREAEIVDEYGNFTTVDNANPVAANTQGCIATCVRTGEGTFTGTFKRKYPQVRHADAWPLVAGGGQAVFTALDPKAGTFALLLTTMAGVASDLPGAVVRISVEFSNTIVTRR